MSILRCIGFIFGGLGGTNQIARKPPKFCGLVGDSLILFAWKLDKVTIFHKIVGGWVTHELSLRGPLH